MNPNNQTRSAVEPLLVDANTAARMLAISPRKLWELTDRGEILCVRFGRMLRYDPDDLRRAIEKHKANGS